MAVWIMFQTTSMPRSVEPGLAWSRRHNGVNPAGMCWCQHWQAPPPPSLPPPQCMMAACMRERERERERDLCSGGVVDYINRLRWATGFCVIQSGACEKTKCSVCCCKPLADSCCHHADCCSVFLSFFFLALLCAVLVTPPPKKKWCKWSQTEREPQHLTPSPQ